MRSWNIISVTTALLLTIASAPAFGADAGTSPEPASNASLLEQSLSTGDTAPLGQPFELTLRIEHPPGATVMLPEAFEPARWELVDSQQSVLQREGKSTTVAVLRFGIFRPGSTTLAPFDVAVSSVAGDETLQTEPVTVKVIPALPDDAEPTFKEARPPVAVWVDDYTLAWVAGGAALLGLLGLIALIAARRRALMPPPPAPPRAAWEVALEKLGALAADDFIARGEYMIFWVRLSEAIREYLGRRYGFPPTELTTSEILGELAGVTWPHGLDEADVAEFLRHCDRVKFGGEVPTREESAVGLRRAFSIVELTRPRTAPVDGAVDETVSTLTHGDGDGSDGGDESATDEANPTSPGSSAPRDRWAPPEDYDVDEERQ